ncbi:MAG: hypothetical protein ACREH8_02730 [Opitutaceae bacterium]
MIVPCGTASPRAVPVAFAESPVPRKPGKRADEAAWAAYKAEKKRSPAAVAARQEIVALREYLDAHGAKGRTLLVALDGSFYQRRFLEQPIAEVRLLCRARKDAVLCRRHQGAGRRFYGEHTFTPESVRRDETVSYGGERHSELPALPKWRGRAGRPSCLDLVTALRGQLAARPDLLAEWDGGFSFAHAVEQAAA